MNDEIDKAQKGWEKAMRSAATPSEELREQLEKIAKGSSIREIQATMAAVADQSYLTHMRERLAAIANPSYLSGMREQLATFANPPYLAAMREQLAAIANPPHLSVMREQLAAFANPPYLSQLREQIAAVSDSNLTQFREQIAAVTSSSSILSIREQLAAMPSGKRMQTEMSAVLASYDELLKGSALASFLVNPGAPNKAAAQTIDVEGFDSLQVGDFATLEIDPAADAEIVKAIADGETASLSLPMMQRFMQVYLGLLAVWDMFIRIMDTHAAYLALVIALSGATTSSELKTQAASLPASQLQHLADYRMVNREGARLRAGPSKAADVIVPLRLGTPVEVLEKLGTGWFLVSVEYNGDFIEGWLYVSVSTAVPVPKASRGHFVDADDE